MQAFFSYGSDITDKPLCQAPVWPLAFAMKQCPNKATQSNVGSLMSSSSSTFSNTKAKEGQGYEDIPSEFVLNCCLRLVCGCLDGFMCHLYHYVLCHPWPLSSCILPQRTILVSQYEVILATWPNNCYWHPLMIVVARRLYFSDLYGCHHSLLYLVLSHLWHGVQASRFKCGSFCCRCFASTHIS